jgi:hypothetical protein
MRSSIQGLYEIFNIQFFSSKDPMWCPDSCLPVVLISQLHCIRLGNRFCTVVPFQELIFSNWCKFKAFEAQGSEVPPETIFRLIDPLKNLACSLRVGDRSQILWMMLHQGDKDLSRLCIKIHACMFTSMTSFVYLGWSEYTICLLAWPQWAGPGCWGGGGARTIGYHRGGGGGGAHPGP